MDQVIPAMVSSFNNVLQDKFPALHGTSIALEQQSKKYCWSNA